MLDDQDQPILIDFGFAKKTDNKKIVNDKKGTLLYVAPEVYFDKPFDGKATDIFSLGAMSWAVIETPVNDILKTFQELIKDMTQTDPDKRPTIEECVIRISDINTAYFSCEDVMNEFLLLTI